MLGPGLYLEQRSVLILLWWGVHSVSKGDLRGFRVWGFRV